MNKPWSYFDDRSFYTLHRLWMAQIAVYTECQLTRQEDKLAAMSGLAEMVMDKTSVTYLAGLWKECLTLDLLWFVIFPLSQRLEFYCGPSWSWAAVDGAVSSWLVGAHDRKHFEPMFSLDSFKIEAAPQDPHRTSQVKSAVLRLCGKLRCARVTCKFVQEKTKSLMKSMGILDSSWPEAEPHLFELYEDSVYLGGYWPDFYPFDQEDVWLLPVCKAERGGINQGFPYWAK